MKTNPLFLTTLLLISPLIAKKPDYSMLDPEVANFLTKLAENDGPPIYTLAPSKARQILTDLQAPSVGEIHAKIQDITLDEHNPDHPKISLRIVRPVHAEGRLPIIIFCHGGGWILGDCNTHDRLVRELANGVHAAVVCINYTPSPEAQYPTAVEQAYSTLQYVAKHAKKLRLDAKRIAIVGDSVGGNMATVVAMLAKERGGPKIQAQVLFYPVTDANFNTESYLKFGGGDYWLSTNSMKWFWDAYAPDLAVRQDHHVSPLRATIEQLRGMPTTLLIVDENDVLRDEGEAYAHKLMRAGVSVTSMRCLGTVHDFVMLDPLKNIPSTRAAINVAINTLKQVFHPTSCK